MNTEFDRQIKQLLPFKTTNGVLRRIRYLEEENKYIVKLMHQCSDKFRKALSKPVEIYLAVQQVRSATVYLRWRKRGVQGHQAYLLLNTVDGHHFLDRQSDELKKLYKHFDQWALQLNCAHSIRMNEIRRLKKYLHDRIY